MTICGRGPKKTSKVLHPGDGLYYSAFDVTHSIGCPTCEQAIRDEYGWKAPTVLRALHKLAGALDERLSK